MLPAIALMLLVTALVLVVAGARSRFLHRSLVRDDAVFPCTVRLTRGSSPRLIRRPRGTHGLARWSHDVLLLHHGTYFPWTQPLLVRVAHDPIVPARAEDRARLGQGAVEVTLSLDDEAEIVVAAPSWARERLAGPFLALAVRKTPPGLPGRRPS